MYLDDRGIHRVLGKKADFAVLPDLKSFESEAVFKDLKGCNAAAEAWKTV